MLDSVALGANIKKYRLEQGLTQEYVAEQCSLSAGYYKMIELGHKTPKLETFIKIAEVLHTPLDKLLSGNVSWTDKINTYEILEKLNELPSAERQEAIRLLEYHIQILKNR